MHKNAATETALELCQISASGAAVKITQPPRWIHPTITIAHSTRQGLLGAGMSTPLTAPVDCVWKALDQWSSKSRFVVEPQPMERASVYCVWAVACRPTTIYTFADQLVRHHCVDNFPGSSQHFCETVRKITIVKFGFGSTARRVTNAVDEVGTSMLLMLSLTRMDLRNDINVSSSTQTVVGRITAKADDLPPWTGLSLELTSLSCGSCLLFIPEFVSTSNPEHGGFVGLGGTVAWICGHFARAGDDAISLLRGTIRKTLLNAASMIEEYLGPGTCHGPQAVTLCRGLLGLGGNPAFDGDPLHTVDGAYPLFRYLWDHWPCRASSKTPCLAGSSAASPGSSEPPPLRAWVSSHIATAGKPGPNLRGSIGSSSTITITLLDSLIYSDEADGRGEVTLLPSTVRHAWGYIGEFIRGFIGGYLGCYTWNHAVPKLYRGSEAFKRQDLSRNGVGGGFDDDGGSCKCPGRQCPPGQGCRSPQR
ncbi:hypothetical protein EKO27_g8922 [Xylaria grammica]|uniref:Uncharacterized protein n=1 Tax=Xylaria grammica TaxID=363999 RepID=A0A439CVY5_9PEZI|nr:hypothetical protein EKO27_g8922 [Xylaria grammica]